MDLLAHTGDCHQFSDLSGIGNHRHIWRLKSVDCVRWQRHYWNVFSHIFHRHIQTYVTCESHRIMETLSTIACPPTQEERWNLSSVTIYFYSRMQHPISGTKIKRLAQHPRLSTTQLIMWEAALVLHETQLWGQLAYNLQKHKETP